MKYATGTGKLRSVFSKIPKFDIALINSPYQESDMIKISYGCGTTRDFNVHIKAKNGLLEVGDYVFEYNAYIDESSEIRNNYYQEYVSRKGK